MALNFPANPSLNDIYSFNGKSWTYNGNAWVQATQIVNITTNLTTTGIAEGSNLYYTDERVYANIAPLLANLSVGANLSESNTDNLVEGEENLYFTNARVYANIAPLIEGLVTGNVDLSAIYANINSLSNSINTLFALRNQVDIDGGVFEGDIDGGEWQYDPNAVDLDAGTY